ncbi:MAG: ROK family protein [Verrucomicrobiales bacterium]|nr:ROK family protein [Verrucomicrobiales bacterium]
MHPRPRETKLIAKKNRILNEIFRSGTCSRFDLARRLNINATMVGNYVDDFLSAKLLLEDEPVASGPGRVPVPLRLNPKHGCLIGIEFEALRARAVLCDFAGEVIAEKQAPFAAGITRDQVIEQILSLCKDLIAKAQYPVLSIGVAAPGQVDCEAGKILHYELLPDFSEVPLLQEFQEKFALPTFIEDNIRTVTFGELLRGKGRGSQNFLCLAARSGVGLGIIIDGKIHSGSYAMAGEAGHMVFPTPDGVKNMTQLVSATGFVDHIRSWLKSEQPNSDRKSLLDQGEQLSLQAIVQAAEHGDQLLQQQLSELGSHLGLLASNLANLFAPEKIILTGEVANCSPIVRQSMQQSFHQYTLPQILKNTYLEDGALGEMAGALGAAWMGFGRHLPEDEVTVSHQLKKNKDSTHSSS